MIMSLVAASAATSKILAAVKIAAATGRVLIVAQSVVDEVKRNREDG